MSSSLLQLRPRVLRIYKRTDKNTELDEAINDAYMEMIAAVAPRKMEDRVYRAVTAGRAQWALPSGVLRLNHPIKLIDPLGGSSTTSSYPLRFITKEEYDFWEPNPDASSPTTGIPWGYTIHKNSIWLVNVPDRNYQLEMNIGGEPVRLVADSDQVIFSETWDPTLAAGAAARLFAQTKQYTDLKIWQGVYENGFLAGQKGGLNLLKEIEQDNKQAVRIVRNNPL